LNKTSIFTKNKHKEKMSNQVKVSKQFLLDGHKEACQSWKERIEKEVPELFKNSEYKKEGWYIADCHATKDYLVYFKNPSSGLNAQHFFDPERTSFYYGGLFSEIKRPATEEEITSALIAEAKRRGFEKGVIVKTFIKTLGDYTLNGNYFSVERECYNGGDDFGLRFGGACIYANGKWASIIPAKEDKNDSLKASVKALEEQLKELKKQIG
jgi:hypothetical protein